MAFYLAFLLFVSASLFMPTSDRQVTSEKGFLAAEARTARTYTTGSTWGSKSVNDCHSLRHRWSLSFLSKHRDPFHRQTGRVGNTSGNQDGRPFPSLSFLVCIYMYEWTSWNLDRDGDESHCQYSSFIPFSSAFTGVSINVVLTLTTELQFAITIHYSLYCSPSLSEPIA